MQLSHELDFERMLAEGRGMEGGVLDLRIDAGGAGNVIFVFRTGFGNDKIRHDKNLDFKIGDAVNHDVLDLQGSGFTSFADVLSHTDLGANAINHTGLDAVTLQGVTKADPQAHTFDLVI